VCMYVRSHMYLCTHLYYGFSFHIWRKTCNLCSSEPGFLCITWWSLVPSIYLHTPLFHSSLWMPKFSDMGYWVQCVHDVSIEKWALRRKRFGLDSEYYSF
jgi:hypothetical protein